MSDENRLEPSQEDVKKIQDWLKSQPHLPDEMDEHLVKRFLYSCNHSLQMTKRTLDMNFTIRNNGKDIFFNRDPTAPEIRQVHSVSDIIPLPKMTKENYLIYLSRLRDPNPDNYHYVNTLRFFFMQADVRIATEPLVAGEVPIMDASGLTLKHLTKMNISALRTYMAYVQEAHPVKLKQIHIINSVPFMDKVYAFFKPMLKDEIAQHIHFHMPGSDTLFKYIPKELLPTEYGGTVGSIDSIKQVWIDRVEGMRDYLMDEEKWKIVESKRPPESKIATEMLNQGSFRSLSID